MVNSLTASKKVMKHYLSELLTDNDSLDKTIEPKEQPSLTPEQEPVLATAVKNKSLEQLLEKVDETKLVEPTKKAPKETKLDNLRLDEPITTPKSQAGGVLTPSSEKSYREGNFQAMFFDVAGLTIAVPLIELGGIHKTNKTTALMGKPNWFKGVMLHRDEKINVVDTALWVMPEKCDENLKNSLNYQYIIMLNESSWGLCAEHLVDTVVLSQDEVKWLDSSNKRPWLAGLVKEKMCALLDVNALIKLLDDGSGIYQEE